MVLQASADRWDVIYADCFKDQKEGYAVYAALPATSFRPGVCGYLQGENMENLRNASCDILLLLDCCYAGASIRNERGWQNRCELLGAAGPHDLAQPPRKRLIDAKPSKAAGKKDVERRYSFTEAITAELAKRKSRDGIDVYAFWLYMKAPAVANIYRLTPSIEYYRWSAKSFKNNSIFLQSKKVMTSRGDSAVSLDERVDELDQLNPTNVLVTMELANAAEALLVEEWMPMFHQIPHNISDVGFRVVLPKVRCLGVHESNSSLLIISMPYWLWACAPSTAKYTLCGIVRSENLLKSPPAIFGDVTVPAEKTISPPTQRQLEKTPVLSDRPPQLHGGAQRVTKTVSPPSLPSDSSISASPSASARSSTLANPPLPGNDNVESSPRADPAGLPGLLRRSVAVYKHKFQEDQPKRLTSWFGSKRPPPSAMDMHNAISRRLPDEVFNISFSRMTGNVDVRY